MITTATERATSNGKPPTSGWSKIEHAAIDRLSTLGLVEIAVYVALLRHLDAERRCWPSIARIASVAGVCGRRARAAVKRLVEAGLVERRPQTKASGATLPYLYHLPLVTPQEPAERADTPYTESTGGGGTSGQGEAAPADTLTRYREEDTGNNRGRAARFIPPSVDDVRAYCLERNNGIDPERFVTSYAAKGWMIGTAKMKDWRAAVRTWERNDFSGNGHAPAKPSEPIKYRDEVRK